MAKKTAAVDIKIGSDQAKNQFLELSAAAGKMRQEIKDAEKDIKSLSKQFGPESDFVKEARKGLAELKLNFKEINEELAAFNPEEKFKTVSTAVSQLAGGFAAAQGAAALFGSESEDLQKTLVKLQGALALSQGLDQLKDIGKSFAGIKTIALDAFDSIKKAFVSNPFFLGATVALTAITAAWGILASKTDEATESIEEYNKTINNGSKYIDEQLSALEKRYEREIILAKASGKETFELEKEKLKVTQDRVANEILALIRKRDFETKTRNEQIKELEEGNGFTKLIAGALNDELVKNTKSKNDKIKKLTEDLKDFETSIKALELEETKKNNDKAVEARKERLARLKELEEAHRRDIADLDKIEAETDEAFLLKSEKDEQRRQEELRAIEEFNGLKLNASIKDGERQIAEEEKILARKKELRDAEFQIASSLTSSLASLGNIFIKNQEKNEAFQKKVAAVQLAIDTAKAISGAVAQAQSLPFPGNVVAIASGVAAVIANIAKAKELLSKVGGSGSIQLSVPNSSPSVSLPDFANQPTINSTDVNQQQTDTTGSKLTANVYITQGQLEENDAVTNSLNSKVQLQ